MGCLRIADVCQKVLPVMMPWNLRSTTRSRIRSNCATLLRAHGSLPWCHGWSKKKAGAPETTCWGARSNMTTAKDRLMDRWHLQICFALVESLFWQQSWFLRCIKTTPYITTNYANHCHNVQDDSANWSVEAVSLVQDGEESIDILRKTPWFG